MDLYITGCTHLSGYGKMCFRWEFNLLKGDLCRTCSLNGISADSASICSLLLRLLLSIHFSYILLVFRINFEIKRSIEAKFVLYRCILPLIKWDTKLNLYYFAFHRHLKLLNINLLIGQWCKCADSLLVVPLILFKKIFFTI